MKIMKKKLEENCNFPKNEKLQFSSSFFHFFSFFFIFLSFFIFCFQWWKNFARNGKLHEFFSFFSFFIIFFNIFASSGGTEKMIKTDENLK